MYLHRGGHRHVFRGYLGVSCNETKKGSPLARDGGVAILAFRRGSEGKGSGFRQVGEAWKTTGWGAGAAERVPANALTRQHMLLRSHACMCALSRVCA